MIISTLLSVGALASAQALNMSPDTALADIELARDALERVHPGYDRYIERDQLDAGWSRLEARARAGVSREQLYLDLSLLLSDIRCDHTKAELPRDLAELRDSEPVYLPFRFRVFEGRMYVEEPGTTGLQRGDEILTVDGDAASDRLAAIYPLIPVDGFTDSVRTRVIESTSEFLGSGFDHFDPLMNEVSAQVQLTAHRDGETLAVLADRLTYPEFRALTGEARWRNFSDEGNVTVEYPQEGVAILRQGTFVNYRTPVDPLTVYGPVFEDIAANNTETLILDMRENGGGSTDAQRGLMAHLLSAPHAPVREVRVATYDLDGLREHLQTWEQAALNPDPAWFTQAEDGNGFILNPAISGAGQEVQPAENAFTGELIILTGPLNSSGATQIIGALRDQRDALLVGEATGGSQEGPTANLIFFLELPNSGIRVRVPAQRNYQNISDPEIGLGYTPDLQAPETLESWLNGADPAMDAALAAAAD
ncbi:S41 family peptidase [Hyphobacterium sp.]|uniref:S41 family peptidase n=1 Tax=Hyphobacterium sp. TaxID=2004662 RepID=UPI003BAB7F9A